MVVQTAAAAGLVVAVDPKLEADMACYRTLRLEQNEKEGQIVVVVCCLKSK